MEGLGGDFSNKDIQTSSYVVPCVCFSVVALLQIMGTTITSKHSCDMIADVENAIGHASLVFILCDITKFAEHSRRLAQ